MQLQIPEQELASPGNQEKAKDLALEDQIEGQDQEQQYEEQMALADDNKEVRKQICLPCVCLCNC